MITENGLGLEGEVGDRSDASKFGTYITVKNGVDFIAEDGRIHDEARIAYVDNCLGQCLDFIQEGGRLEGYFLWSLMDNFEWALGYSKRFGITYVDFNTFERTIKDSGYWFRDVIKQRGLS
jgi:beta-glucosidase